MSQLKRKAESWTKLKELYSKYEVPKVLDYQRSNAERILKEIRRIKRLHLPRKQNVEPVRKIRVVGPTRGALYKELKQINPNVEINYRKSKVSDLYNKIYEETRRRNNRLNIQIRNRDLITFLTNPVNEITFTVLPRNLREVSNFIGIPPGFLLRIHFEANGDDEYKFVKDQDSFIHLLRQLENGFLTEEIPTEGSDEDVILEAIRLGATIDLTWYDKSRFKKNNNGAYFMWFHNLDKLDLTKYQVYTKKQKIDYTPCIIFTLQQAGVHEDKLDQLRLAVKNREVLFRDLSKIANMLEITLNLTYHDEKQKKSNKRKYGNTGQVIEIGIVSNHYFTNELTNITASAIKHYDLTKDCSFYPEVFLKSLKHKPKHCTKYLTSYEVIRNIYNQRDKHLKPITIENINNYTHVESFENFTSIRNPKKVCFCKTVYCEPDCKKGRFNEYRDYSKLGATSVFGKSYKKTDNPNESYDLIYLDLETFLKALLGYHVPYCLGYQYEKSDEELFFYGLDCVKQFLDSLKRHAVVVCHNLSFDFRGFIDHLYSFGCPIESGTKLKHIQCVYEGKQVLFKDSMAFLAYPLRDLTKMFRLEGGGKECYPYTLINENNIESMIPIEEVYEHLKPEDHDDFKENCIKIGAIDENDLVDIKAYTLFYCNSDVRILKQAHLAFRRQIKEITGFDIIEMISLPQLADKHFKRKGCHDGCFSISGVAEQFIHRCSVGGRVMSRRNEKWHIKECSYEKFDDYSLINGIKVEHNKPKYTYEEVGLIELARSSNRISDFDAVSLYPSAMARIPGYLKGLPKVLSENEIKNFHVDDFDYYFVEIEVLSIGIKRDFPLLSIKDKKTGVRDFTNDVVGHTFHVDKVSLQDVVNFQKIEFRVIQGYKYTDGFNTKIVEEIQDMFQKRLALKQECMCDKDCKGEECGGNGLETAYKLLMNSGYGKMIQKAIRFTKTFYRGTPEQIMNYVIRNADTMESYTKINDNLVVAKMKKSVIQHFTACHMACQVLSMSKRIMNQVMCLAEDSGIPIFYQDTDSMHLFADHIEPLAKLFEEKYNRKLIGEQMSQFHTDFKVKAKRDKSYPITSVESIIVSKKTYIDKLEYKDLEGNLKYDYHIRAKGLPSKVIKEYDSDYIETYKRFFKGDKKIDFDLVSACKLKFEKNYRVRNNETFPRSAYFPNGKKNVIF